MRSSTVGLCLGLAVAGLAAVRAAEPDDLAKGDRFTFAVRRTSGWVGARTTPIDPVDRRPLVAPATPGTAYGLTREDHAEVFARKGWKAAKVVLDAAGKDDVLSIDLALSGEVGAEGGAALALEASRVAFVVGDRARDWVLDGREPAGREGARELVRGLSLHWRHHAASRIEREMLEHQLVAVAAILLSGTKLDAKLARDGSSLDPSVDKTLAAKLVEPFPEELRGTVRAFLEDVVGSFLAGAPRALDAGAEHDARGGRCRVEGTGTSKGRSVVTVLGRGDAGHVFRLWADVFDARNGLVVEAKHAAWNEAGGSAPGFASTVLELKQKDFTAHR